MTLTTARLVDDDGTGLEVLRFDDSIGVVLTSLDIAFPDVRATSSLKTSQDGTIDTTLYTGARTITAELLLPATGWYSVEDALRAVLHPAARYYLHVQRPGWASERRILVGGRTYTPDMGQPKRAQIGWSAPLGMFEDLQLTGATLFPSLSGAGGGITLPTPLPFTFTAGTVPGAALVTVAGTAPTPITVDFYGPCTNPSLLLTGKSQKLALNLSIAAGDFVRVDFDARTIWLNNDQNLSKYASLNFPVSSWWPLPVGHQVVAFNPATAGVGAQAVVTWRSRWI